MIRRLARLSVVAVTVISLAACAAPVQPNWTFAPAASGGTTAAASGAPEPTVPDTGAAAGSFEIKAFDLGFDPSHVMVDKPGTYAVTFKQHRRRAARRDVRRRDEDRGEPGRDGHGERDRARGRDHLHLLDPRPLGRRDAGRRHGRRQRGGLARRRPRPPHRPQAATPTADRCRSATSSPIRTRRHTSSTTRPRRRSFPARPTTSTSSSPRRRRPSRPASSRRSGRSAGPSRAR